MDSLKMIEALSNAKGVSGFEEEVVELVKTYAPKSYQVEVDYMNNVFMADPSQKGLTVLVDGHSDEVGFMVQSITKQGLLRLQNLGGWVAENTFASPFYVRQNTGDYCLGIVSTIPPHFQEKSSSKTEVKDLLLDVGATSKEEVKEMGIEIGAPVIPKVEFSYNETLGIMMGKAFDNRLGTALTLELLTYQEQQKLPINLLGTISVQEEVGIRGAKVLSNHLKPDLVIIFEGTPADDLVISGDEAQGALKMGPQIRHMDRTMISHPKFVKFARQVALDLGIDFQDAVRRGGGTNGSAYHMAYKGVPTIVIGVPVRYAHTHYGISSYADYQKAYQWAVGIIETLSKEGMNFAK